MPEEALRDLLARLNEMRVVSTPWRISQGRLPGARRADYDDSGWTPVSPTATYRLFKQESKRDVWFRCHVTIPESLGGEPLRLSLTGEGSIEIWIDGRKAGSREGGLETPFTIAPRPRSGAPLLIAIHARQLELIPPGTRGGQFWRFDTPEAESLRGLERDLFYARLLSEREKGKWDSSWKRFLILAAGAEKAGKARDLMPTLSKSMTALGPMREAIRKYTLHICEHSHIDLAWGWQFPETQRRIRHIFSAACDFLDGGKDRRFVQDQTAVYREMEDGAVFERVKAHFKTGRWDIAGGEVTMPCAITPSGESFVRQFLYGKRWFKERFGVDVKTAWRLDCFGGHAGTLPQILAKCGMDTYVFKRGLSPDIAEFWWESPDGSRVLGYNLLGGYNNGYRAIEEMIRPGTEGYFRHSPNRDWLFLSGTDFNVPEPVTERNMRALEKGRIYPTIRYSRPNDVLNKIDRKGAYPELAYDIDPEIFGDAPSTGCLLTQGKIKQRNRELENKLATAEKLAVFAPGKDRIKASDFAEPWRRLLFNQMHDIFGGTCEAAVYADVQSEYDEIERAADGLIEKSMRRIGAEADTRGPGVPLLVFNPLSWEREGAVRHELYVPRSIAHGTPVVIGPGGKRLATRWTELIAPPHMDARRFEIEFRAEGVPSLGFRVFHLAFEKDAPQAPGLRVSASSIENEFLRVRIHPRTGNVSSIREKKSGRELLRRGHEGNVIQAFEEQAKGMLAWATRLDGPSWTLDKKPEAIEVVESGPVRAAIRVRRKFRDTTIHQEIALEAGSRAIDFVADIDSREGMITYKALFPLAIEDGLGVSEMPYGALPRLFRDSPGCRRRIEATWPGLLGKQSGVQGIRREGEWSAQNWLDISNARHGAALLNRGRYLYDVDEAGGLRLSLLRNVPGVKDEHPADSGRHRIQYRLLPHQGDWRRGVVRAGMEFNAPMLCATETTHGGSLGKSRSFLRVSGANAIIATVKPPEDGAAGMIVRLQEPDGARGGRMQLHLDRPVRSAAEIDMIEWRKLRALQARKSTVAVSLDRFEVKTLRVR